MKKITIDIVRDIRRRVLRDHETAGEAAKARGLPVLVAHQCLRPDALQWWGRALGDGFRCEICRSAIPLQSALRGSDRLCGLCSKSASEPSGVDMPQKALTMEDRLIYFARRLHAAATCAENGRWVRLERAEAVARALYLYVETVSKAEARKMREELPEEIRLLKEIRKGGDDAEETEPEDDDD